MINGIGSSNSWFYRALWVIPFIVNLIAVSIPGRFDSQQGDQVFKTLNSLFEPSGWAFAIWGIIYLGEMLLTAYSGLVGQPQNVLKSVAPYWLAGNLFQSLWCLSFRPEFKSALWLPMSLLAFGAISFAGAEIEMSSAIREMFSSAVTDASGTKYGILQLFTSWEGIRLLLMRFPISLHTGWLAAASLLNFNAWVAESARKGIDVQIAAAFLSSYFGAAFGGALSVYSGDPFVAFTVAWALAALADRTFKKALEKPPQTAVDTLNGLARTELGLSFVMRAIGVGVTFPALRSMF